MRLNGPANVLIMPAIHSATISTQLIKVLADAEVIGPILLGLTKPIQICPLGSNVSKILQMAAVCAYDRPLVEVGE
jgi:malate dehydrogenase (oxaloacetate-decarboxylating)(NADP+)